MLRGVMMVRMLRDGMTMINDALARLVSPILMWTIFSVIPVTRAQLCTKSVRVEDAREEVKRIQMKRRIPAACSNWDRSWAWLTKIDCSTKYKSDFVDRPSRIVSYRKEYECCPDDTECKNAEAQKNMELSDEKFLAITFGSATAALSILILIIVISICRRKKQSSCRTLCKGDNHVYETTNDNEPPVGFSPDSRGANDNMADGCKFTEPEYEEICDRNSSPEEMLDKKRPASVTFSVGEPVVFEDTGIIMPTNKVFNDPYDVPPPPYHSLFNQSIVTDGRQLASIEESCKNHVNENLAETLILEERLQQSDYTGSHYNTEAQNEKDCPKWQEFEPEREKEKESDKDEGRICDESKNLSREHRNIYADFDDLIKSSESAANSSSLPSENEYEKLDIKTRESEKNPIYETLNIISKEDKNEPKILEESTEIDCLLNHVSVEQEINIENCDPITSEKKPEVDICS